MVSCPFHKGGKEKKPSCGLRKDDGWCHCFTCGESCSLEELIGRCFGVNDIGQFGISWLKNNFLGDILENRDFTFDLTRNESKEKLSNAVSDEYLDLYRYYHPYMFERKLTEYVINLFDIGFDKETNCITFPVRDKYGQCLFVARRSVFGKYFNYPGNVEKPIYGIYELYLQPEFPKEIYICESMIDALTLWGIGKYAVAMNGLGTNFQYKQLNELPCRKYILATDNDNAGYNARVKLRKNLKNKIITEIQLPERKKGYK